MFKEKWPENRPAYQKNDMLTGLLNWCYYSRQVLYNLAANIKYYNLARYH